jgi:hypothetical protein
VRVVPVGFVYLTSDGTSIATPRSSSCAAACATASRPRAVHAGQGHRQRHRVQRRQPRGFAIAQNWLDLDAERGPSSFDQRHQFTAQAQYTTGAGITGGTLVDGVKGRLLKDWTFVGQLTVGSGLPLTPVYLVPVPGTGYVGSIRARLTGSPPTRRTATI